MNIATKLLNKIGYVKASSEKQEPEMATAGGYGTYNGGNAQVPHITSPWAGEKTYGEMGAAYDLRPVYQTLALRSWDAYLNSDIAKAVINNYVLWSVGSGLTLQAYPERLVLESEGINFSNLEFNKLVRLTDARFKVHANSRYSTLSKRDTLQTLASEVKKNISISGDCLIVNRYSKQTGWNTDLIDGLHVCTPPVSQGYESQAKQRGNKIIHGVEVNSNKTPIAFYVIGEGNKYTRIPARSRALNKTTAYLVYRDRYRVDYVRGLPLLSVVLETLKKLDRYKEASVSSAEEVVKIAYQIVHGASSTGKNPLSTQLASAAVNGMGKAPEQQNYSADKLASSIASTTNKQVFNNTPDSRVETLEHKNELYFREFWEINFNIICGALGIPPEVALGRFEQNFSSSRMAAKAWEYAMQVDRKNFKHVFYKPFYDVWFMTEVMNGKIKAPGYLEAILNKKHMSIEAYTNCNFIGASVPHVDPVKEVQAQRLLLGDEETPLTTFGQASERLNTGDYEDNIERYAREKDFAKSKGLEKEDKTEINE